MRQGLYNECESFLTAVLRGETPMWPEGADPELMLKLGIRHGVNGLVEKATHQTKAKWPELYIAGLADEARQQTGHEILRRRELVRVLGAFAEQGVTPLIMKGAALAYTHYATPALRPRCDIDLLVKDDDRDKADAALQSLAYTRGLLIPGRLISYEQCFFREEAGCQHLVDLHWKINNRQVFARTFSYDDLLADAVPVAAIGTNAQTLSPVHALLLACMHRVGSLISPNVCDELGPFGVDRLIWLYDIHLLQMDLDPAAWRRLRDLAARKGIIPVVRHSLERSNALFGTAQPPVDLSSAENGNELSKDLLNANRFQWFLNDLQCLSWRDRLVLIKETLLPPRHYMLNRYGSKKPLAFLYLWRAISGLRRKALGAVSEGVVKR